jgi:molybdopterin molybdotransferase
MIRMATVDQARELLVRHGADRLTPVETVALADAHGRRLAEPVAARVFQPPAAVSAMDGYAVRFADMAEGATLTVTGESRAGVPWDGPGVGPGEAVRIFTGAHVPPGADHILIQEDARREGDAVTVTDRQASPSSIRRKGLDFSEGDILAPAGQLVTASALALIAAGNVASVCVRRRPRVGVLATGDELKPAGADLGPGQVVNSIAPALLALLEQWGAEPVDLGIAADTEADVQARIARPLDLIVSIGGASVGDYDVVRAAFAASGFQPELEKVAVKPGKPTWFSASPDTLALGLPGNPAAAMVTARLFFHPLLAALTGGAAPPQAEAAFTAVPLPAIGPREEFLRAILTLGPDGRASVRPASDQDSSLLNPFLTANALIRRPPRSPAAAAGDLVPVFRMD